MARTNLLAHSANLIVIKQDNREVGVIQSLRMNDDYAPEPLSGVGEVTVQEHVTTVARYSLTVQYMSLRRQSMFSEGLAHITPEDSLRGKVFDIEVQDKITGRVLKKYEGCTFASGDVEVTKHAIVSKSAQFMALRTDFDMTTNEPPSE